MIPKLALSFLAAAALVGPVRAEIAPSFDCAKAQTPVENAICADEALAEEDHAIAVAFQSLMERSDAELADAVRSDQRTFIAVRDEAFELGHIAEEQRQQGLLDRMQYRAEFLNWINTAPPDGLEGSWRNELGMVTISRNAHGFVLKGDAADQVIGSWLCSVEGSLVAADDGTASMATDEGQVRLVRHAGYLEFFDARPDATQGYCGLGGAMAGAYFYVGATDD